MNEYRYAAMLLKRWLLNVDGQLLARDRRRANILILHAGDCICQEHHSRNDNVSFAHGEKCRRISSSNNIVEPVTLPNQVSQWTWPFAE